MGNQDQEWTIQRHLQHWQHETQNGDQIKTENNKR